jgi:hypothetical protein
MHAGVRVLILPGILALQSVSQSQYAVSPVWELGSARIRTGDHACTCIDEGELKPGEKFEQFTPGPSREELNHMLNLPELKIPPTCRFRSPSFDVLAEIELERIGTREPVKL